MRRHCTASLWLAGLLALAGVSWAIGDVRTFDSPEQEAQYRELTEELRCTVCQNQNISDSNAELARDLREKTYQLVREGKSKAEIKDYMVQRYGNFVLYRPPITAGTFALWAGPFLFLVFGAWLLIRVLKRRREQASADTVDEAQLRRAAALLRGEEDPKA
jgi:cytochrome c-type biogenesis protein CcmH